MKKLYCRIDDEIEENAIAQHFFNVGYHLRQLIETSTMSIQSRKWKPQLNILRSELSALTAYKHHSTEWSAPKISAALAEAVQNGVKGRPNFADLRIVFAVGKSTTRVEEEYREENPRAWFMVGILAANCDLLPMKATSNDELREVDLVLLNFLGSVIKRGEAESLVRRAYNANSTLQNAITDWLHAQNMENVLTELPFQKLSKILQEMQNAFGDTSLSAQILERAIQIKKAKTLPSKPVIVPKTRQTKRKR